MKDTVVSYKKKLNSLSAQMPGGGSQKKLLGAGVAASREQSGKFPELT